MSRPLDLFILAGEPSGDRIAADLVRRLRARTPLALRGVGGDDLIAEGLVSLFPMGDLSVMGLSDVVKRLPLLLLRVVHTARAILSRPPDIVVLVDAQEFSRLVAKYLRARGYRGKVLLYVAPSVWARAPQRAARLKPLFDEVLSVLPFEPAVMRDLGGPPTRYAGHPALAEGVPHRPGGRCIALLPGSRAGELRRHLPMFRAVAESLFREDSARSFFLPTLPSLAASLERETAAWAAPVAVVADRAARTALYAETELAIVCAGTATLELALAEIPMVVTYVMDRQQVSGFARLGNPRVGLPNIILAADVTPELVLPAPDAEKVATAASVLLAEPDLAAAQVAAFRRLRALMEEGAPDFPRCDPAQIVLDHAPAP